MGIPARLMRPLRSMYGQLRRRFKILGGVGDEFVCTNGILQGCPISVILVNALMAVWARHVEDRVPGSIAEAYADDTQGLADTRNKVTRIAKATQDFAQFSGQLINPQKSFAFTT
eukprot:9339367-Karenia_brevis.AAC.1